MWFLEASLDIFLLITLSATFLQVLQEESTFTAKAKNWLRQEVTLRSCAQAHANELNLRYAKELIKPENRMRFRRVHPGPLPVCQINGEKGLPIRTTVSLQNTKSFPAYWPNWVIRIRFHQKAVSP